MKVCIETNTKDEISLLISEELFEQDLSILQKKKKNIINPKRN